MSKPRGSTLGRLAFPAVLGLAVLVFLSGCTAGPKGSASSITLAGSTSVQPFAEMLAEEYQKAYPDRPAVNVQGGGSSAGARAALSGAAQVGTMSRELGEGEDELTAVVIAHDAIAVVVNPANPISGISVEDLKGVFSGEITDWSQLGGSAGRISVISREEGSGTRSAFEELVMKGTVVAKTAVVQDSNGAVRETVAQDEKAIGYISLGLVDSNVKPLSIGGTRPSVETVKEKSYTLVRPFLFVTKGEMAPQVKQFVDYVLSPDGQKVLAAEGLVVGN
ncbi:MAG: phosphate ABC transporter substrate-binding protein [Bacillota bacterium]